MTLVSPDVQSKIRHRPIAARVSLFAVALSALLAPLVSAHAESGRFKHKPLSRDEQQRVLSEAVMNDGSLQIGDIVVTDRGSFVFEGIGEDGFTNRFRAIANPVVGIPGMVDVTKRGKGRDR